MERLSNVKESPTEAALSFIQSIDIPSFDDLHQVHMIGKVLRFFPGQSNAIRIPGSASDVDSRRSFFLLAVEYGYCALVARLLEEEKIEFLRENRETHISLLEQKDHEGRTPFLIASSHANVEMLNLLLNYGCNTLASDMRGKSCLTLLIAYLPQNPIDVSAAIGLLGEYPDIPWNSGYGKNTESPLHSLVDMYRKLPDIVLPLLVFLIEKGASPDLVDSDGYSPLDYAMKQNQIQVVRALTEHGAGRTLNITLAEEFFHRNSKNSECNRLHSELIHYSLLLRWNLALSCLQNQTGTSSISIEGAQLGILNSISSDLEAKLFDNDENIRSNNEYGRRNVYNFEIQDQEGICYEIYFKQHPELPGIEYAVDILFELVIGHGTSYTDLAKVTHPSGTTYPIIISQGIAGENLQDVLKQKPHFLEKLNEQYFSELLIASMLVNFEDAKPDNFILEALTDGSFRLVGIDNDHAFIPPVTKKGNKTELSVKCILYCMDQMKTSIHPKAREKFISLSADRILTLWLNRLSKQQEKYYQLFPASRMGVLLGKKKDDCTIISIPFQEGTIVDIYQKFERIQSCLRASCDVTGLQLLRAVIPELGIRYEQAFLENESPSLRFKSLVETQYSTAIAERVGTLLNSRQVLKSMRVSTKDLAGETIGPQIAIQELYNLKEEIEAANSQRIAIQQELGKGKLSLFENLQLDTEREKIINGLENEFPPFDFSLFENRVRGRNVKQPVKLLESVLCGGNYRSLHIHRCTFVETGILFKTNILRQIMQSSPQLVSLELFQCSGINVQTIQCLSSAPCLSSLACNELSGLEGSLVIPVSALRSLQVSYCQSIFELKIPNTLKTLVVNQCRNLKLISAHFLLNRKIREEDESYRLGKLTMRACIKHPLWTIFNNYLNNDKNHFLYFEQFPLCSFGFEYFFDILWSEMAKYPLAIMAQDLCRHYDISFDEFFTCVLERYGSARSVEPSAMLRIKLPCVKDYAIALDLVSQLSNSVSLDFSKNQLTGEIPKELTLFSNLKELILSNNQLTGEIHREFGLLTNIERLSLNNNQLSGEIPKELSLLSRLTRLDLSYNQLTGEIPKELSNLSNVVRLTLNNNQLTGEIPQDLSRLTKLNILYIGTNQLTGEIPTALFLLSNLSYLTFNNNQLTGEIPKDLSKLSNLNYLYLSNNQLTGAIPEELTQLSTLKELFLSNNEIVGEIPLGIAHLSNLTKLTLSNNQLTGEIPPELAQLSKLSKLYLSNNQLVGDIPPELAQLSKLKELTLSKNQLTGEIPLEFTQLSSLTHLYLSNNQLSGEIPRELSRLSNLVHLTLNNNQLTGEIPCELAQLSNLAQLTLSNNQLTGEIPADITQLTNLNYLYMSNNQLTGEIPPELTQTSHLKLTLSTNQVKL